MTDVTPSDAPVVETPPGYTNEPPPSYESVLSRLKQAKRDSKNTPDFFKKTCAIILCGSVCTLIYLAALLAIPIAMIVVGALRLHDCPLERFIPIFMVVGGASGAAKAVIDIMNKVYKRCNGINDDDEDAGIHKWFMNAINCLLGAFALAWHIAGSVWVYGSFNSRSYDITSPQYCERNLYLFAFWVLTVGYIIAGLGILFVCCWGVCVCMVSCCAKIVNS